MYIVLLIKYVFLLLNIKTAKNTYYDKTENKKNILFFMSIHSINKNITVIGQIFCWPVI